MSETKALREECAGCHKFLGGDRNSQTVSHGLCKACLIRLYPEFAGQVLKDLGECYEAR